MLKRILLILVIQTVFISYSHALVIKIATVSPDGTSWMKRMRAGAKEISKRTNRRVRFKFYPGGVMGDHKAVLRKIKIGQLQGGAFEGANLSHWYPDSYIYMMPMQFRSMDEARYVRKKMDADLIKGLEKGGLVVFGFGSGGLAYPMSVNPVQNLETLRQQKVWGSGETALKILNSFGIKPVPLPLSDVLVGLQTGLVNAVGTSSLAAVVLQWHTQLKYIINEPVLYVYASLGVTSKVFKKISKEDQKIVREVMGKVYQEIDAENIQNDYDAFQALQKKGMKVFELSQDEKKLWRNLASQTIPSLIQKGKISQKAFDTFSKHLSDYRKLNNEK